jgi:hypothetical protein
MILARPTHLQAGTTLVETLVAATLVGAFFVTIFEVNAVCLRYIEASKECVAAVQGVQDRVEGLRNLAFSDLISPGYMMSAQPTPSPSGPRPISLVYPSNSSDLASQVEEVVTVSGYPSGTPFPGSTPTITYTRPSPTPGAPRPPGALVYPTAAPATSPDFSSMTMVKVKVKYTWTATLGGRQQSEETETLIAAGTKK